MVFRRYHHITRIMRRVQNGLKRILRHVQNHSIAKEEAIEAARRSLNGYYLELMAYVWRSRIQRDLTHPRQLGLAELERVRKTVDEKLDDFKRILQDVT